MENQAVPFKTEPFRKGQLKEQVSPHKIAVLVLIDEYCTVKKHSSVVPLFDQLEDSLHVTLSEKHKWTFMVLILDLLQATDLSLRELCMKLHDKMPQERYTMFLKKLQELVEEGVGSVKDFFYGITLLLENDPPTITKSSVLGLFIRRMVLTFEKLSFSQVTDLYNRFKHYYEDASLGNGYEESQDFGGSLTDSAMSLSGVRFSRGLGVRSLDPFQLTADGKTSDDARVFHSQRQAEFFIQQQVMLLQHNQKEALSPSDLNDKLMDMLETNPDIAEAHFLSYINSLRVNEYCTALHNLYHYFDRKTTMGSEGAPQGQGKGQKEEVVYRRYAALNLAALHYRFGHRGESRAALNEAIGLAQDANDNVCLQHALGWLQRLSDQGTARTENLLERAVAKSTELNLHNLASIGIQAFARHNAFATAKPSQVFEYLQRSDVLNCQYSQAAFMCTSYANKAALWHMYGKREMMSMLSQLILHLDTSENGIYHNGESICVAICNLARSHAQCGQYNLAMDLINCAKKRFPKNEQFSDLWMSCEQEVTFDRSLLNRKLSVAEQCVLNMKALCAEEAELRTAILNKEQGQTTVAFDQLHRLLEACNEDKDDKSLTAHFKCRVLLCLSELYSQTGNPVNATDPILECITTAKSHHLEHLTARAAIQLAYVQLQMHLPDQGLSLLTKHMLPILSHGSLLDKARLLGCYARCQVAIATRQKSVAYKRQGLQSSIQLLGKALELYQTVEAYLYMKDTLYLQARLHHELGNMTERNRCSHQFKHYDLQYPTVSVTQVNML